MQQNQIILGFLCNIVLTMAADKLLHKIQGQINELTPILELFVDENVQPSANDCILLQKQLSEIQETIAVYKFNKQNKEVSPSFNLHAKLSEVQKIEPQVIEIIKEELENKPEFITPIEVKPIQEEVPKPEPISRRLPALAIGINDKFRFMNELFAQNAAEYNIAIEQINNLISWNDTELYLHSLKNVYGWKDTHEVVKYFYSLVKKRFDPTN